MKREALIVLFAMTSLLVFAQQDMTEYKSYVQKADSLYDAQDYSSSVVAYQKAFDSNDGKAFPNDRYNAACSFALS